MPQSQYEVQYVITHKTMLTDRDHLSFVIVENPGGVKDMNFFIAELLSL